MTPLVLVHGFLGGAAQWGLQNDMPGGDRRLIPIALPGFGHRAAEPPITTIQGMARNVIADLDALGVTRFDLLGHSMGGMIVQEVAQQAADRVARLVLYSTGAVGILPGRFETIAESKTHARTDGVPATARRIAATWFLDYENAAEYAGCAAIAEKASPAAFDAGLDAMEGWSGAAHLSGIAAQTLVLWGDGDRTYPWAQTQRLWQGIPGARLAVVPGCAHAVHLERPALFNSLVSDFLHRDEVVVSSATA